LQNNSVKPGRRCQLGNCPAVLRSRSLARFKSTIFYNSQDYLREGGCKGPESHCNRESWPVDYLSIRNRKKDECQGDADKKSVESIGIYLLFKLGFFHYMHHTEYKSGQLKCVKFCLGIICNLVTLPFDNNLMISTITWLRNFAVAAYQKEQFF
jgi:hypothetical protein